jgi:hypothetical protein
MIYSEFPRYPEYLYTEVWGLEDYEKAHPKILTPIEELFEHAATMIRLTGVRVEEATASLQPYRPAKPHEYKEWLNGYLARGGEITHTYNYPMPDSFYVATRNFPLKAMFGSEAKHIIVPAGVEIDWSYLGHNTLYYTENFSPRGPWVPSYTDTV